MARNKMSVDFKGVDKFLEQLKRVDGAAERAVDKALKATQELIAVRAAAAIEPHNQTHVTADQIITDGNVLWTHSVAEIAVGFRISDDAGNLPGLPSIFLMYGTEQGGQVHTSADQKLYDAVYGNDTKKQVRALQQAAFDRALKGAGLVD